MSLHTPTTLPQMIALCGYPKAGKSTAAALLCAKFGYIAVDDGLPLRQIAMKQFNCTKRQVFTQAGKLEKIEVMGEQMEVRDLLGRIGLAFENEFGDFILPSLAHKQFKPGKRYVMASVRRNQPDYWASLGALVVEVKCPSATGSRFAFDQFTRDKVTHELLNPGVEKSGLSSAEAMHVLYRNLCDMLSVEEAPV